MPQHIMPQPPRHADRERARHELLADALTARASAHRSLARHVGDANWQQMVAGSEWSKLRREWDAAEAAYAQKVSRWGGKGHFRDDLPPRAQRDFDKASAVYEAARFDVMQRAALLAQKYGVRLEAPSSPAGTPPRWSRPMPVKRMCDLLGEKTAKRLRAIERAGAYTFQRFGRGLIRVDLEGVPAELAEGFVS